MRSKYAIVLWVWALCILLWTAKYLEPVEDWRGWAKILWQGAKAVLLIYSGIILITAEQEIKDLEYSNNKLEGIIGDLQDRRL